ncbi:MAG TPA: hypothetical protein ENK24_01760 [Anaerolineae bacterium]|nr:hypothetical protein [Anaerolineae bacterium]
MMNRRLASIIGKTLLLWLGIGFYLIFSLNLFSGLHVPEVSLQKNGPVLFWQNGAIYTINPDGTNLTKITPALRANQRFTAVSPGCHGLAPTPCMILVGHVLYHISGTSLPLPTLNGTEWLNAPASWSPDGVYLAYPVANSQTEERSLLLYNTREGVLTVAANNVDESIQPAWSTGCVDGLLNNCYLAYRQKLEVGNGGAKAAILNLGSNQRQSWPWLGSAGHILKWSAAGELYLGGQTGWFNVRDGSPAGPAFSAGMAASFSPAGAYVAYSNLTALQQDKGRGIWLSPLAKLDTGASPVMKIRPSRLLPARIFIAEAPLDARGFTREAFWSPQGNVLAAFAGGQLVHYNLVEDRVSVWFQTSAMDNLGSYAFSPLGDGLALVEEQFLDNPEKPQHRLFIVYNSGEIVTLRERSPDPVLLLAWLPGDYEKYLIPYKSGEIL